MFGSTDRDVTKLLAMSTAAFFSLLYYTSTIFLFLFFEYCCKITGLDEQFLFTSRTSPCYYSSKILEPLSS